MIPIYEQGHGNGIGHNIDSFLNRFDAICHEHVESKRAKSFAFILYDFTNNPLRKILKNQGVFARLDRLAGKELSVFYLHTGTRETINRFNSTFLEKLGVAENASLPCVVFFSLSKDQIDDVEVALLDNADLIHGFHELYGIIEKYLKKEKNSSSLGLRSLKILKSSTGFISLEVFRAMLRKMLETIYN